ncbi:hypothetical protein KC722_01915 [Candidatus Kaiserbacteria bacterium]|nr:hypothetical protein [Candidatus Kaiserbacteria bacterium]MCB9811717.1 hypothetical protein [Candidatus Nomurabacteria bacterium]
MNYTVVPSLPAKDFTEITTLATALRGVVSELQIDIVDGQFVPPLAWPFTEPAPLDAFSKLALVARDFSIEMDCMVARPEQYLDVFVTLGVKRVVIHMGSTEAYENIFAHANAHNYTVGFALMNDRPLQELELYMDKISFVQLMGIKEIGQQGQPFDERTLKRAHELHVQYPTLEIAVDGSVNKDTIARLKQAGVNRFLPGSAVAKQADPATAYRELVALIN